MVMIRTGTIVGILVLALSLVGLAMPAAGQTSITNTHLAASADLLGEDTWDGDDAQGFIYVTFCWEGAGFNPQEMTWDLELEFEDDTPDWMELEPRGDWTASVMPPMYEAKQEGDCAEQIEFNFNVVQTGDLEPDHTHPFNFEIVVSGDDAIGTYAKPSDESVTGSLTTGSLGDPGLPPEPGSETENESEDEQPDTDTEESPAPAFAVFAVLSLAGAAILRRRA